MPKSNLPNEALGIFYRLSLWVERERAANIKLKKWRIATKRLTIINCIKPRRKGEELTIPKTIPLNTLYLPLWASGKYTLRQIRHAFCHDDIEYLDSDQVYKITQTDKVAIEGVFTLDGLREFVGCFF